VPDVSLPFGRLVVSNGVKLALVNAGAVFWPVNAMIVLDADMDWQLAQGCAEARLMDYTMAREDIGEPEELVEPYGFGVWPGIDQEILRARRGRVVMQPGFWFVEAVSGLDNRGPGSRDLGVFAGRDYPERNMYVSKSVRDILQEWDIGGALVFEGA
jgi:hypothetical protein